MSSPEATVRIGRGQARISALDILGLPPLSNADRLKIGAEGARNLISGTIQKNRKKKRETTDIQLLTDKILEAAGGKPLKISITEKQEKEQQNAEIVKFLLLQRMNNPDQGKTEQAKPAKVTQ